MKEETPSTFEPSEPGKFTVHSVPGANHITFTTPRYSCKLHGEHTATMHVNFGGDESKTYCMHCLCREWEFAKMERVEAAP